MSVILQNKTSSAVAVVALTVALLTAFQMKQVLTERDFIKQQFASQDASLAQVDQVNKQFESLAVGTSKLAGAGNETAQAIMSDLRRIGVIVNPNATPGQKALEFKQPEQQQPAAANGAEAPKAAKTTAEKPAAAPAEPKVGN